MKSMTGYGRDQISENGWTIAVEVNSVNRKQLEIAPNLPREIASLEPRLREMVAALTSRGRINIFVSCNRAMQGTEQALVDLDYAAVCHAALRELQDKLGLTGEISVATLAAIPGVIRTPGAAVDADAVWPVLEKVVASALRDLIAMREREGAQLAVDLRTRLDLIRAAVGKIRELHAVVVEKYRASLHERVRKAGVEAELDDERLYKEVVLFADRCDISEELTRLGSHLGQFMQHLGSDQPVGRTLEFLIQEIGRELNTLGAKGNDAAISQLIVTCKAEMERIREQVQNLE